MNEPRSKFLLFTLMSVCSYHLLTHHAACTYHDFAIYLVTQTFTKPLSDRFIWMDQCRALFRFNTFFSNIFWEETVGFSGIRTRIFRVEGKHADHKPNFTAKLKIHFLKVPYFVRFSKYVCYKNLYEVWNIGQVGSSFTFTTFHFHAIT